MDWRRNWLLKKERPTGRFFNAQSSEFKVQMWCRIRDGINYLGPAVKPRDDKFLSYFILRFFYIVIPAQAGIHCAAGICVVAPRHI